MKTAKSLPPGVRRGRESLSSDSLPGNIQPSTGPSPAGRDPTRLEIRWFERMALGCREPFLSAICPFRCPVGILVESMGEGRGSGVFFGWKRQRCSTSDSPKKTPDPFRGLERFCNPKRKRGILRKSYPRLRVLKLRIFDLRSSPATKPLQKILTRSASEANTSRGRADVTCLPRWRCGLISGQFAQLQNCVSEGCLVKNAGNFIPH